MRCRNFCKELKMLCVFFVGLGAMIGSAQSATLKGVLPHFAWKPTKALGFRQRGCPECSDIALNDVGWRRIQHLSTQSAGEPINSPSSAYVIHLAPAMAFAIHPAQQVFKRALDG